MDEQLFYMVQKTVKNLAVREGYLMEEQGTLLKPETIKLVEEIQQHVHEMVIESLIDQALATGDKDLFMKLTAR